MYNEEVKVLLETHFGPPQRSRTIGGPARSKTNSLYYYDLDFEKILPIRAFLETHSKKVGELGELTLLFDKKKEREFCARYSEDESGWRIELYLIRGISYHKSYGGHIGASLILSRYPLLTLAETAPLLFGYWTSFLIADRPTNRFSYHVNVSLSQSSAFREFTASFFSLVGEKERQYILKDLGRAIKQFGCFLPPVELPDLLAFHNPADLVRHYMPADTNLKLNYNKLDLNSAFIISMLAPVVRADDLRRLDPSVSAAAISKRIIYDKFDSEDSVIEFIASYYSIREQSVAPSNCQAMKAFAWEYARLALETDTPVRLDFSCNRLLKEHDRLAEKSRSEAEERERHLPLVAVPSVYDALEEGLLAADPAFERIRDTQRLAEEGESQHNCVFSYRKSIRSDKTAIFHWDHEGGSYTLEFSIENNGPYVLRQIKDRYNEEADSLTKRTVKQILDLINLQRRLEAGR